MEIIGHGIDLVEIARIQAMLANYGRRFTERCFTEAERSYADRGRRRPAERYAARFACKEAVLKALGTGLRDGMAWTDIAVVVLPSGRPTVELSGRCAELAAERGIRRWDVSLSHAGAFATASAIACGGGKPEGVG